MTYSSSLSTELREMQWIKKCTLHFVMKTEVTKRIKREIDRR
jgi:hypothetical protein